MTDKLKIEVPKSKAEADYLKLREQVIQHGQTNDGRVDRKLMAEKAASFKVLRDEQRAEARNGKRSLQEEYVRRVPDEGREEVAARLRGEKHEKAHKR